MFLLSEREKWRSEGLQIGRDYNPLPRWTPAIDPGHCCTTSNSYRMEGCMRLVQQRHDGVQTIEFVKLNVAHRQGRVNGAHSLEWTPIEGTPAHSEAGPAVGRGAASWANARELPVIALREHVDEPAALPTLCQRRETVRSAPCPAALPARDRRLPRLRRQPRRGCRPGRLVRRRQRGARHGGALGSGARGGHVRPRGQRHHGRAGARGARRRRRPRASWPRRASRLRPCARSPPTRSATRTSRGPRMPAPSRPPRATPTTWSRSSSGSPRTRARLRTTRTCRVRSGCPCW